MIFGTFKQHFVKTFLFQDKRAPEMYVVEFVELK